jgi:hypothetical protein
LRRARISVVVRSSVNLVEVALPLLVVYPLLVALRVARLLQVV